MRSILLSIMLCLISSVSWCQTALWADLVENPGDGLVYKKFDTEPFTGTLKATADDPIQRSYKDGSKHGEWVEFDANGLVKSKSLFEDGQLRSKSNYKDGEQHGLAEEYYESGQVSQRRNYKDGKLYRDGKLFSGLVEWHYENGQLGSKENYKDGKLHGLWEFFKEDGSLIYSYKFENGQMVCD